MDLGLLSIQLQPTLRGHAVDFIPDTINPPAGMGTCGTGRGMHYPMQRHACAMFATSIEKRDLA